MQIILETNANYTKNKRKICRKQTQFIPEVNANYTWSWSNRNLYRKKIQIIPETNVNYTKNKRKLYGSELKLYRKRTQIIPEVDANYTGSWRNYTGNKLKLYRKQTQIIPEAKANYTKNIGKLYQKQTQHTGYFSYRMFLIPDVSHTGYPCWQRTFYFVLGGMYIVIIIII